MASSASIPIRGEPGTNGINGPPQESISTASIIETPFLIVGAGPAGASLACFLARYGHTGLMISSAAGTASTPRAHMNNMAALQCLRDLDVALYDDCMRLGNHGDAIKHYRWCESLAGEEYARNYSWGNGDRKSDYDRVSPCTHIDLPQNLLEPMLVKWATNNGFSVRFSTEFISMRADGVCKLLDRITKQNVFVKAKYIFGCDGGRSVVARELDLPMTNLPGGGLAYNVVVRTDLTHLMAHRQGNLHWCMRIKRDYPFMAVARMVKPWYEWMFVFLPKGPGVPVPDRSYAEWSEIIKDVIEDENVEVEVMGVSKWVINETYANEIMKENVFCLGDAIHRHPPTLGLGSNTCIQDAFNLSWKVSLVHRGLASPSLLHTYNTERQPVAAQLVTASNDILRSHAALWATLGCKPFGTPEAERLQGLAALRSATAEGSAARRAFQRAVHFLSRETHALGMEMGQYYSSTAIYASDEPKPFTPQGNEAIDPYRFYEPSTYPGRRVPHVWLRRGTIPDRLISTLELVGGGQFALLTGVGGQGWHVAAEHVRDVLGVDVRVSGIGFGLEFEDVYLEWYGGAEGDEFVDDGRGDGALEVKGKSGVASDGCVLVRPDSFVAWRAQRSEGVETDKVRLERVLRKVLGMEVDEKNKSVAF